MLALLPHNFVEKPRRSLGYACVFSLIMKQNFCAYLAHLIYTSFLMADLSFLLPVSL